jgi:hypothetical protein
VFLINLIIILSYSENPQSEEGFNKIYSSKYFEEGVPHPHSSLRGGRRTYCIYIYSSAL